MQSPTHAFDVLDKASINSLVEALDMQNPTHSLLALRWQRIHPIWYRVQRRLRWRRRIYSTAAVDLPSTSARWHRGIDVSNARATSSAVQRLP